MKTHRWVKYRCKWSTGPDPWSYAEIPIDLVDFESAKADFCILVGMPYENLETFRGVEAVPVKPTQIPLEAISNNLNKMEDEMRRMRETLIRWNDLLVCRLLKRSRKKNKKGK